MKRRTVDATKRKRTSADEFTGSSAYGDTVYPAPTDRELHKRIGSTQGYDDET